MKRVKTTEYFPAVKIELMKFFQDVSARFSERSLDEGQVNLAETSCKSQVSAGTYRWKLTRSYCDFD